MPRISSFLIFFTCFILAAAAAAEPRVRSRAATSAELARLERRIEEQHQLIEKLIRLQAQYLQQLTALLPGERPPEPAPPVPPRPVEPPRRATSATAPAAAAGTGTGTIVGKISGAGTNAYVYVDDISAPSKGAATMKQVGKQFKPQVLAVVKGTRVDFPNLDTVFHNVFSVSPGQPFDLGSYSQGGSKTVSMNRPGVVTVYCNMHPQMVGHILVTPSTLVARVGADGFFRLPNVPVGRRRVVVWAPNAEPVSSSLEVGDTTPATLEVALVRRQPGTHKTKDGLPYGSYRD